MLPHLKQAGRGALIHVSSVEARRSLPYYSAYAAAKHGIDGFLEALRVKLMQEKVPVSGTNIMPASINKSLFNKSRTKIGVKPQALPLVYSPQAVANAILYVAEHLTRDFVVGDAGQMMLVGQRLSPQLMDTFMLLTGFQGQKTVSHSRKMLQITYLPIAGFDRVEGDFSSKTQPSVSTWLDTHPSAKWSAIASLLVAVSVLVLLTGTLGADKVF